VPDAYRSICANRLIERPPGWQVLRLPVRGVREKLLDGTPVLENQGGSSTPDLVVQQAQLRALLKLLEHARHGRRDGQPLVNASEAVDSHADQKDDEITVDMGGKALGVDFTHGL
jgi:hypothetical protein